MRINLWTAYAAVVLVAATACSSSGGKSAAATTAAATNFGDARLSADLPSAGQLPAGWSGPQPVADASVAAAGLSGCPALDPSVSRKLLPDQAQAEYRLGGGTFLIDVLSSGTAALEDAMWSQYSGAGTTCQSYNVGTGSSAVSWSLQTYQAFIPTDNAATTLAYANIGVTTADPNAALEEDFIIVRKGNVLAEIIVYSPTAIGSDPLQTLVAKVTAKIK